MQRLRSPARKDAAIIVELEHGNGLHSRTRGIKAE
jgi:hypothetical protein